MIDLDDLDDLDGALRADAQRWRAAQHLDRDLDAMLEDAVGTPRQSRRRLFTALAAAAAVVVAAGAVALVSNWFGTGTSQHTPVRGPRHGDSVTSAPSATPSASTPLAELGGPPDGQRTLFRSSGRSGLVSAVEPATGRGEVYAVCLGGGTIGVDIPRHGGFDVNCTGVPAGASLPSLGRTVRISHVTGQHWRVVVYGH